MSFIVENCELWHLTNVLQRKSIEGFEYNHSREELQVMAEGHSWAIVDTKEAEVVGCGGTLEVWRGRHIGWMYATEAGSNLPITAVKAMRRFLDSIDGRIESTVIADFEQGNKLMKLLGFKVENEPGILKGYGPTGEDHIAYVRLN